MIYDLCCAAKLFMDLLSPKKKSRSLKLWYLIESIVTDSKNHSFPLYSHEIHCVQNLRICRGHYCR